mmetsp:Transcript_48304/g.55789  ORF Transcript_48304/g.55789 Transcript_48304/m.55789 type:complete len:317 (-) Transcript_48304:12-962(-)
MILFLDVSSKYFVRPLEKNTHNIHTQHTYTTTYIGVLLRLLLLLLSSGFHFSGHLLLQLVSLSVARSWLTRHKCTKHAIPQHDVLTKVAQRLAMVVVVGPHIKHIRELNVEPCVVERRQRSTNGDKNNEEKCVDIASAKNTRHEKHSKKMVVLSDDILNRVNVDRVGVAAEGCHLSVVMLMNQRVNRLPVQCPVEERVKEIVNDERHWKLQRHLNQASDHGVGVERGVHPAVAAGREEVAVVHEQRRHQTAEGDVDVVNPCELLKAGRTVWNAQRLELSAQWDNKVVVKVEPEVNHSSKSGTCDSGHDLACLSTIQ